MASWRRSSSRLPLEELLETGDIGREVRQIAKLGLPVVDQGVPTADALDKGLTGCGHGESHFSVSPTGWDQPHAATIESEIEKSRRSRWLRRSKPVDWTGEAGGFG
jgi:hypothetical protein